MADGIVSMQNSIFSMVPALYCDVDWTRQNE